MKFTRIAALILVFALFAAACGKGNVFELEAGQCFDDVTDELISDVPMTDCADPHDNEVYAVFDTTAAVLPSNDTLVQGCFDRFEAAIGEPYSTSIYDIGLFTPTNDSWDQGDREVVCYGFIFAGPEKMVGSILGSGR
jgi:putative regulator of septum formation